MLALLLFLLLLPLALTSPHLAPYLPDIKKTAESIYMPIWKAIRKPFEPSLLTKATRKIYTPKKSSDKWMKYLGKASLDRSSWDKVSLKSLPSLPTLSSLSTSDTLEKTLSKNFPFLWSLLPKDPWALASKTLDDVLDYLPKDIQNTLSKFFVDDMGTYFFYLFIFRYFRLFTHFISFWFFYSPDPVLSPPSSRPKDCTVILPTLNPETPDFDECLTSCLINEPGVVIIITVGNTLTQKTKNVAAAYQHRFPSTKIAVKTSESTNKRIMIATGLSYVGTKITVLLDDNVFWPSPRFLPTLLAPFEDPEVGIVGTNKRVRRTHTGLNLRSFWNMMGALYIERQNFEMRATNAIDGGVSVISGRTSAHRSIILTDGRFIRAFTNETFLLGMVGPLADDGDNFITRWNVSHHFKIKVQYSNEACVEMTLRSSQFLSQCIDWVRTAWRSNWTSLFGDGTVWFVQPWSLYAIYFTSFVNFALLFDGALIYTLTHSKLAKEPDALKMLIKCIFFSKMIKLTSYFLREPQDLLMLPGYFIFAYFHSIIKLYGLLTFWVTGKSGRLTQKRSSPRPQPRSPPAAHRSPERYHEQATSPRRQEHQYREERPRETRPREEYNIEDKYALNPIPKPKPSPHDDIDIPRGRKQERDRAREIYETPPTSAPAPIPGPARNLEPTASPAKRPRGRPRLTPQPIMDSIETVYNEREFDRDGEWGTPAPKARKSPAQKAKAGGVEASPGKRPRGRPRKNAV